MEVVKYCSNYFQISNHSPSVPNTPIGTPSPLSISFSSLEFPKSQFSLIRQIQHILNSPSIFQSSLVKVVDEIEGFLCGWKRSDFKLSNLCNSIFFGRNNHLSLLEFEAILSFLLFDWLPSNHSLTPPS